jgi:hypothetical protein
MDHPAQFRGVELVTQQYLATKRALNSRDDLAPVQYERLKKEIVDAYKLRCTQERKIALAQMRADYVLLRRSNGRASMNSSPVDDRLR